MLVLIKLIVHFRTLLNLLNLLNLAYSTTPLTVIVSGQNIFQSCKISSCALNICTILDLRGHPAHPVPLTNGCAYTVLPEFYLQMEQY